MRCNVSTHIHSWAAFEETGWKFEVDAKFAVLLDLPIGGQGRWRSSDKYLVVETPSDSDWSANQTDRRSTGCGVHLLNGSCLFGSSRTQRVVTSSSCESERHAMISILSDGICLKRCLAFCVQR